MGRRPIIGITPGFLKEKNKLCLGQGYVDGISKAGGLAYILPLILEGDMAERIMESCDGFLFSGGPDIDARFFGEENMKCNGEISPQRDQTELLLAGMAIERNKPVLGICRGIQLLNVAIGGTLHQDIISGRNPAETLKHWQEAPDWYPIHEVHIEESSKLYSIFGTKTLRVNSFHHQAIKETGQGVAITARTSDGIIEAVEYQGNCFTLAVQWHPELMWQEAPLQLKLFEAFVSAGADT